MAVWLIGLRDVGDNAVALVRWDSACSLTAQDAA